MKEAALTGALPRGASPREGRLQHYLINVLVAFVWCGYAWATFDVWRTSGEALKLILFARNGSLTLLFLCRRRSAQTSRSTKEWVIGIGGTFVGYLFGDGTPVLAAVTTPLMMVSGVLMTASILALGRSFGIVPANRGIKTEGPYAIVRHPIYVCYLLFDTGYLLGAFSLRNLLVHLAVLLSLYLRATYEERILRLDSSYEAYTRRTRYMFIPGVL